MSGDEEFRLFHNRLRILSCGFDRDVLVQAGVLEEHDEIGWRQFNREPHRFFYKIPTERAKKLWALMEAREPLWPITVMPSHPAPPGPG
jgi:hypothetical protein